MKKPLWVYVVAEDLSIFVLYFLLLKYNLTQETYSPRMKADFPGAPDMDLLSMFAVAAYLSGLPLLGDLVVLTAAERVLKPQYRYGLWTLALGFVLHIPIVVFWQAMAAGKLVTPNVAFRTALVLSFVVAGASLWALKTPFRRGGAPSKRSVEV